MLSADPALSDPGLPRDRDVWRIAAALMNEQHVGG